MLTWTYISWKLDNGVATPLNGSIAIGKIRFILFPSIITTPDAAHNEATLFVNVWDGTSPSVPETADALAEPPRIAIGDVLIEIGFADIEIWW